MLRAFRRDEDGVVVAMTLFFLLAMLIAGSIAVDVMRQEMQRARIQNTLDTAVLAGAGAPYGTSPKAIVEDYFAKAHMSSYLDPIDDDGQNDDDDVVQTLNSSKVTASAGMTLDTYLMRLVGVNQLNAAAGSAAERRVPKLEVSMVLDVSGSMGSNNKLVNLKTAGKKFITTILNSAEEGDAVISIVPFSWDVSPGENILNTLNVDKRQDYSSCLQFSDDDFEKSYIDPAEEQLQLIYTSERDDGFDKLNSVYRTCYDEPNAEILPYSISESDLQNKIDDLIANGNTSGNIGMKWGAALLDPKFQSVKEALNGVNVDANGNGVEDEGDHPLVSDLVGVVPAAYDEPATLKVIVMMGDGANTYSNQFPENSQFRGPNSFLYHVKWTEEKQEFKYAYKTYNRNKTSNSESKCSKRGWSCEYDTVATEHASYYLYHPYNGRYYNLDDYSSYSSSEFNDLENNLDGFESKNQLSWEQAWGKMSPDFLDKIYGYDDAEDEFEDSGNRVQGWEKDDQMSDICTAIKKKNVIVYTIGFEVPKGGTAETELKKCATSPAHYYPAQGISITDAFSSIASNVVNLRLTQ